MSIILINITTSLFHLPQFADESNTKSIIEHSQWNSSQCVCSPMAWKKCMGSKSATKDWIFRQQRQGRREGQQEVEGRGFVQRVKNWRLWGAYQRLILGKGMSRGRGQQSSTVERHLEGEFWMPCPLLGKYLWKPWKPLMKACCDLNLWRILLARSKLALFN